MKCQMASSAGPCEQDACYVAYAVRRPMIELAMIGENGSEVRDVFLCEEHMKVLEEHDPKVIIARTVSVG